MKDRVRDLFAVPPAEFVRVRDALAKELRGEGHEAEAKEVAALRRPTAAVWAVNQLARRNGAELESFLDASERVRHAQVRRAAGEELRAAMTAQRAALAKLEQAAAEVLRDAGAQASPGAVRSVQSTLQAAATGGRDVQEQLREGTLRETLEPAGFEALLAAGPVRATSAHRAPERTAAHGNGGEKRRHREAERQEKEDRRAAEREERQKATEARKRARAARAAETRLRKLEQRAKAAQKSAEKAREAVETARAELERLRT
jgi:hypothetical protein